MPLARLQAGFTAIPTVKNNGEEGRKRVNSKSLWFNDGYKATSPSAATPLLCGSSVGETGCHLEVQSCCWHFLVCDFPHSATVPPVPFLCTPFSLRAIASLCRLSLTHFIAQILVIALPVALLHSLCQNAQPSWHALWHQKWLREINT